MFYFNKWLPVLTLLLISSTLTSHAHAAVFSREPDRDTLILSGTPLITPIVRVLAEAFKKSHPTVDVFVENSKNDIAFNILKRGNIDVALTSVVLSPEQDTLLARGSLFARGALVVVANEANKVDDLKPQQIHDIYVGKIKNWRDLGGEDKAIKISLPMDGSVDLDLYKQVLNAALEMPSPTAVFIENSKARLEHVTRDEAELTFVRRWEFLSNKLGKLVKINGMEPTDQGILSQLYPLYIGYYMVLWGKENKIAQEFVDFTLSEEGQKIVAEQGQIAVQ